MSLTLEQVTANLAGKVRREKLHGRDYFVAPLSMIVPGVLNGSDGPIYYPPEEGAKSPDSWNIMPIVVNHPKDKDGKFVSARDPEVLNAYGIGYVFRANHSNKLAAEGWFDLENTKRIEPRVYNALERNQVMPLSTGLFIERQPAPEGATFNGMAYTHIARNYRPDHLAILPDSDGACSVKDGCGLNVNQSDTMWDRLLGWLGIAGEDIITVTDNAGKPSASLDITPEKACQILKDGKANGKPLTAKQRGMFGALCGRANNSAVDVLSDQSTTNEAQPLITNQQGEVDMLSEQVKKQIVDSLIANCGCQGPKVFNEADRDYLTKLSDDRLQAMDESRKRVAANETIVANAKKGIPAGDSVVVLNSAGEFQINKKQESSKFTDPQGRVFTYNEATQSYVLLANADQQAKQQPNNVSVPFATNRQLTEEEWKRMAPPRVQQMTSNYERWEVEQKNILVNQIQSHPNNVFSVEQLQAMEMQMLRNLASIAGGGPENNNYAPSFAGAAAPFSVNYGNSGSKFAVNEDADMAPQEIDWSADSRVKQSA
jgi:hypothetical protein